MILIEAFIKDFPGHFPEETSAIPWNFTRRLAAIIYARLTRLNGHEYDVRDGSAIHRSAILKSGAIIEPPAIIGENCFIGSNACLRGGVFLAEGVVIGMGCEIKTSVVMALSAIAHFNFVGDSLIGARVNMEAGAVVANHYNERKEKNIYINYQGRSFATGAIKFGALIGDDVKIGANAVLSPGTILPQGTIVKRLELVDQSLRPTD